MVLAHEHLMLRQSLRETIQLAANYKSFTSFLIFIHQHPEL
jgi:hypothetical protein